MQRKLRKRSATFRMVRRLDPLVPLLGSLAVGLLVAAIFVSDPLLRMGFMAIGGGVGGVAVAIRGLAGLLDVSQTRLYASVARFVEHDATPALLCDPTGLVIHRNRAADDRLDVTDGTTLSRALADLFANPSQIVQRLQSKALALGAARDDVVTRKGHMRLSVHAISREGFLWRVEEMAERGQASGTAQSLSLPMMTASASGAVLFMNDTLRRILGGRAKSVDKVFRNLPVRAGAWNEIAGKDGPVPCLVAEMPGSAGRKELFLLPGEPPAKELASDTWSFFDELPVPLLRIAQDGVVGAANRPARDLLRQSSVVGAPLARYIDGLGRPVLDWLADAADGKGLHHPEFVRLVDDAEEDRFVQISLNRVMEAGETQIMAVLTDATELKALEAQFAHSQKMQAVGQLAGGIAHDFNNLLTAITGHCDLLLLRHDSGDAEYGDLMQIHQNANRAASLVGQLLAFSRKQTLTPEVLSVEDLMLDMGHLLNRLMSETVSIHQKHASGLPPIRADKRQLEQVLMNLVVNARDAMPSGGNITISTKAARLTEPLLRDRAKVPVGDYVLVRVADQGTGIPEDKVGKIFEPFFTTKAAGEGTGLGLSTAYGIVKQTGGFIFVDTEIGKGTTFTIYLPATEEALPEVKRPPLEVDMDRPNDGTVLLVEDEAPVRAFASRALRLRGFTVLEADSAEAALETLERTKQKIDIFVTDVVMPGRDGPSWVGEALKDRPDTRVIFVSGYARETFSDKQAQVPNSVFLPKPFSLNELTRTVQDALH
ncbi:MAG: ATP-binding response regulator [Shimia sp.]